MEATTHIDLIERLAAAVAKQVRPSIPLEVDLWDIATIATYLKRSEAQVRERLACRPDFPKAIRLPTAGGARGHALYPAKEILAWVFKYRDKN